MPDQFPPNDPNIGNDDFLYRRARGDQITLLAGGGYGGNAGLFRSSGGPLSFDLVSKTTSQEILDQSDDGVFHIVKVPVSVLRAQGCSVVLEPENNNAAQVHVYGKRPDGSLSGAQARHSAASSTVVLVNPNAPLPEDNVA